MQYGGLGTWPTDLTRHAKCRLTSETGNLNEERYPHGGVKVQAETKTKDHNGAIVPRIEIFKICMQL